MNPLIEKYLNASLTAGEAAALAQALAENPALADEFAAATRMECDLRVGCKEQAHTALYTRRMERAAEETETPAARRRSWSKPLAAAAGVALLAGGGMAFLEFRQQSVAQPEPPPRGKISRVPALIAEASTAAGAAPRGDAAAMKRKLRRFVAGSAAVRGVPVSQALSSLESQWKSFDHRDAKEKDAVAFTIADAVLKTWANPDDEPRVNLEIPGISLLTSVELIAAQAGLRAAVTPVGVTLEPEKRADDGRPRTWNLQLPAETFTAFLARAGSETERARQQFAQYSLAWSYSPVLPAIQRAEPSWLKQKSVGELVWEDVKVGISGPNQKDVMMGENTTLSYTAREFIYPSEFDPPQVPYTLEGLPNLAWTEPPVDASGQPMKTIDDLIGDALHVQQNQVSGFETHYDPAIVDVEATFAEDGQTIDLNLAPEIIEFDGFINYGEPIQATGITALGMSAPVTLTDSKITQPVFTTRTLVDHPATLISLLAAHGANTDGLTWDETNGAVTARGTLSELRIASAVLAAVRESASAGFILRMERYEWKDDVIPDTASDTGGIISSSSVAALRRNAGAVLSDTAQTTGFADSKRELDHYTPYSAPGGDPSQTIQTGWGIEAAEVQHTGSGIAANIRVIERNCAGHELINGVPSAIPHANTASSTVRLQEGDWLRLDMARVNTSKAVTFLITIQPAVLP
jgi:hypothetical protein